MNDYKKYGRLIGNLAIDGEDSPKFRAILASITAGGRTAQTVVYSNFYEEGTLKLSSFFKASGVKHRVLTPSMAREAKERIVEGFRDRRIQIVLLHPSFTEGLSLLGAEQMHILEPILHPAMEEQVIARVSRYKSHEHLPAPERRVQVSIWICTVRTLLARMRQKSIQHRLWAEYQPWMGPLGDFLPLPPGRHPGQSLPPDQQTHPQEHPSHQTRPHQALHWDAAHRERAHGVPSPSGGRRPSGIGLGVRPILMSQHHCHSEGFSAERAHSDPRILGASLAHGVTRFTRSMQH